MLGRILLVCFSLGLYSAASPLGCRWITDQKFRQHSQTYLELIANMAYNSTNTTEDAAVSFPNDLHKQASNASAEDKLAFTVQILDETAALFEEDHSSASWDESTEENFLMAVTEQADKLRSCMGSHGHKKKNKKLHLYFKRLSSHILKKMHHSAEAWELVRKAIEIHLMRADQLVSPLGQTI